MSQDLLRKSHRFTPSSALSWLALLLMAAQLAGAFFLRSHSGGALTSSLLELTSTALAGFACYRAARWSSSIKRKLLLLATASLLLWSLGQIFLMFNRFYLL